MVGEDTRSDAEVVALTLRERDAFAVLISRYEAKLDRYVRRLGVRRDEDRSDLLQDIFIKVYRNLHSFDSALSFSAWIYRIAHNETMSWFRKRNARPEGHLVEDSEAALGYVVSSQESSSVPLNAHDRELVAKALDLLPEKYRTILVLRFFEERTYEEIADILKIPMGTVATLVFRAKDRLRKILVEKGYAYQS